MDISSETKIVGLIGNPVEHSMSPSMQNPAFQQKGLNYAYVTFKVEEKNIEKALEGIKGLEIEGVNVTIPHKSSVIPHLDNIENTAKKIGAVNTIKREKNELVGHNTDGKGALKSLKNNVGEIKNKKVLMLGAGGAAKAIGYTLVENGATLTISNRSEEKGKNLASEISEKTSTEVEHISQKNQTLKKEIKKHDILVDSTSVGMHPNEDQTLLKSEMMDEDLIVMDIVYNPKKTKLLREAEKAGATTISGLEMLVYQGAESFEIWTGENAPIEVMLKKAEEALEG